MNVDGNNTASIDVDIIAQKVVDILGNYFLSDKDVLNVKEACLYLGLKKVYVYELIRNHKIPYHHSSGGKLVYFKRTDLDKWALGTRIPSMDEVIEKNSKKK